jgi:hypothetical protein
MLFSGRSRAQGAQLEELIHPIARMDGELGSEMESNELYKKVESFSSEASCPGLAKGVVTCALYQ